MRARHAAALLLPVAALCSLPVAARADASQQTIDTLQAQITALQQQLNSLKAQTPANDARAVPDDRTSASVANSLPSQADALPKNGNDPANPTVNTAKGGTVLPGLKITAGGFVAAEAIERSKNQTADVGSSFNALIPFRNSVNAHQTEFRGSARASRLTLLAEGTVDATTKISGYGETDFLGAAPTANAVESNSFTPRVRVLYATLERSDYGFHILARQNWSLATMNKVGIFPRQENITQTIDSQYVPGFVWTRNVQLRAVKDFDDKKIWAGVSLESPQVNFGGSATALDSNGIAPPPGVTAATTGNAQLGTASYSADRAPDIIAKIAYDPGYGHYEAFGLLRFFHDTAGADFQSHDDTGEGIGGSALIPVIPKKLDWQGSVLVGNGIGRYASGQLPDFAFGANGAINPLHEVAFLTGFVGHPTPNLDLYLYAGGETIGRSSEANTALGYGDAGRSNAACNIPGGVCPAQTSSIWQVTPGLWQQLYKGSYGSMKIGLQDSLTRRNTFSDAAGIAPHAYENTVFTSLRYYPAP